MLTDKRREVHIHDIAVDHRHVVPVLQGIPGQDRDQITVNFHGIYTAGGISKILCQRTDTRADLQNRIIL